MQSISTNSISKLVTIHLIGASLVLSACAKKDDNKEAPAPGVPVALSFSKPVPGEKLTRAQYLKVKQAFSNKPSMILPPGELIFSPKEMTAEMKKKQEAELRRQDTNSYDLLKRIQAGCVKSRPTAHVDATFPADGQDARESLRAGDYFSASGTAGLNGDACPVDALGSVGYGGRVEDRNLDADTGKASGTMTSEVRAVMKDSRFASLLGARGMIIQSSMSGLVVLREVSKAAPDFRQLVQMNLNGTYLSLSQDIPFTANYQFLSQTSGRNEMIVSAEVKVSETTVKIDMHSTQLSANGIASQELYVNGHITTQEEFNKLFGNNDPGQIANTTASFLK